MIEKIKTAFAVFLILLLFPYIIVMLSGRRSGEVLALKEENNSDMLEAWVLQILPGEMPVTYEIEALKAQAVVARSNLAYRMQKEGIRPKQLNEDLLKSWEMPCYSPEELEKLWGNEQFEEYYEKLRQAVSETSGKVLTYQGKYVDLPYHAVSAGWTRDGSVLGEEYSYLKSVECPEDREADGFLAILRLEQEEIPEILEVDEAGYVTEVRMGESRMAGEEFRRMKNLQSSSFSVQESGGGWIITTKGLGHGFGLSMHQAQVQAFQGKVFLEILQYFYDGMECISFS